MNVLTLGPTRRDRVVLFAAGAGGDPERYGPLLEHLAANGCQVIAPSCELLVAREASTAELLARPFGLVEALRGRAFPDTEVVVVGHSIGGWAALCLAGATPWGRDRKPMEVPREPRFQFMHSPPPGSSEDSEFDRDRFLIDLAQATLEFVIAT